MTNGFKDEDGKFHPIDDSKHKLSSSQVSNGHDESSIDIDDANELKNKKYSNRTEIVSLRDDNGYWSFTREKSPDGDEYFLNLHDPMGWMWSGNGDSLLGFLVRISKGENFIDDFSRQAKEQGLTYNKIKPKLLENLKDNDAFYEIAGDNGEWHFGGDEIDTSSELEYFKDEYELSDEQVDKISNDLWGNFHTDYDDFIQHHFSSNIKREFTDIVKKSKSFEEFSDAINNESFTYDVQEAIFNYKNEKLSDAIHKTLDDMGIKAPDEG